MDKCQLLLKNELQDLAPAENSILKGNPKRLENQKQIKTVVQALALILSFLFWSPKVRSMAFQPCYETKSHWGCEDWLGKNIAHPCSGTPFCSSG